MPDRRWRSTGGSRLEGGGGPLLAGAEGKSIGEAITNPVLVVEVLSDSTERYDRDGKFEVYKKLPSFDEYVLVSQDERRIEVRKRDDGAWTARVAGSGETVEIHGRELAVDFVYGQAPASG